MRLAQGSAVGYYDWRRRLPSRRELDDTELADKIGEVHKQLSGRPGVRRVWAELTAHGWRVSRKRVWRLVQGPGLQGVLHGGGGAPLSPGRYPIDAPDLIGQSFDVEQVGTVWAGDITYIATVDGWCARFRPLPHPISTPVLVRRGSPVAAAGPTSRLQVSE